MRPFGDFTDEQMRYESAAIAILPVPYDGTSCQVVPTRGFSNFKRLRQSQQPPSVTATRRSIEKTKIARFILFVKFFVYL